MLELLSRCKFHLRFAFNPLIRHRADNLGSVSCINAIKRDVPLIVSLTSYGERFDDLVISIYSLLNQTIKPDRLILWLGEEYEGLSELPYEITRFIKNGLEIRFVKDIRSYTKIIYALKEFPDAVNVTADDDIYYPKDWLEKLYYSYIANPDDIQVHRAHRVILNSEEILPYEKWEKHVEEESARFDNFITGVGGALYPPRCFTKEVLREDVFLNNAPNADDIWLWVMALVHNRKIRVVKNHIKTLCCVDFLGQLGFKNKRTLYSQNRMGGNDEQLGNLLKLYSSNVIPKLK